AEAPMTTLSTQLAAARFDRGQVPKLDGAVAAGGQHVPSVGAELGALHKPGMRQPRALLFAAGDVPNPGSAAIASGHDAAAIPAEGDVDDLTVVEQGWRHRLAGRGIPKSRRVIVARRGDQLAVGTEFGTGDIGGAVKQLFADPLAGIRSIDAST